MQEENKEEVLREDEQNLGDLNSPEENKKKKGKRKKCLNLFIRTWTP